MLESVVVDTNVVVSALLRADSAPRQVLRACLRRQVRPLMENALFAEYEAVTGREALFAQSILTASERRTFLDDFCSVCQWVSVYYLWRPNLRDEADNHLLELAVAGGADAIVTGNTADFEQASLRFPDIAIMTPRRFLTCQEH